MDDSDSCDGAAIPEEVMIPAKQALEPLADNETVPVHTIITNSPEVNESAAEVPETTRLLKIGDKLGKYEIRQKIGQGGMGAVYLAFDPMIEREVAIKVLPQKVASQPKAIDRFLSEARSTGKLNHPNVVAIYDIATEDGFYYIVMELVRGGSGAEFIANRKTVDWKRACEIAADASDGLAAAHSEGLVHRDIKPENLMLTGEGVAKVVDFGLTKLIDATNELQPGQKAAGQVVGTPHYMSPEQFQGHHVDARSDVYSMGATLFSLLAGSPPFAGSTNLITLMTAHLQQSPPNLTEINNTIPTACRRIVEKAMAKEPQQRFRDASELASALRDVIAAAVDSSQIDSLQSYHQLKSTVVVEPSKMQAMMFERSLKHAGVTNVAICGSAAEALRQCESESPDLLITAMQLTDMTGIELIRQIRRDPVQNGTVLVINSSDSNIDQFVEIGQTGPLAVVSRKTKPDELLRALCACTFLDVLYSVANREIDATALRYGVVCDALKIPPPIEILIRQANLLDVQVSTFDDLATGKQFAGAVDLVIALRTAGDAAEDAGIYTDLLSRVKLDTKALAAVQVDGDRVTLRAAQMSGFTVISRCRLDGDRLKRLIQLC